MDINLISFVNKQNFLLNEMINLSEKQLKHPQFSDQTFGQIPKSCYIN